VSRLPQFEVRNRILVRATYPQPASTSPTGPHPAAASSGRRTPSPAHHPRRRPPARASPCARRARSWRPVRRRPVPSAEGGDGRFYIRRAGATLLTKSWAAKCNVRAWPCWRLTLRPPLAIRRGACPVRKWPSFKKTRPSGSATWLT